MKVRWRVETIMTRKGPKEIMVGRARRIGRPRKTNVVRDRMGKSRGEVIDLSVVLDQPHRRIARGDDRKSVLLGYALGRLRFVNAISEDQLTAGNEWALLVRSYAAAMGIPMHSPASAGALMDAGKTGYVFSGDESAITDEEREKRLIALRRRYDDCYERLCDLEGALGRKNKILISMRRVCIEDRDPTTMDELGDLRNGLNSLAAMR